VRLRARAPRPILASAVLTVDVGAIGTAGTGQERLDGVDASPGWRPESRSSAADLFMPFTPRHRTPCGVHNGGGFHVRHVDAVLSSSRTRST